MGRELDLIENLLIIDRSEWTDSVIVAKALELHKNSGGKVGGAVLNYYDRLAVRTVGGALAQAAAPVVIETDPSGEKKVLVRAPQVTQARIKLEGDILLGLLDGFARPAPFPLLHCWRQRPSC